MKTDEYKDKGYLKILGLVVIVVLFVFAFILLINKHTSNLGDVINTSFNVKGEPIVCTPEEAIDSFERMNLDYLALGKYLIKKK